MKKRMSSVMIMYLLFAIAGALVPWYFNVQQMLYGEEPFTMLNWLKAGMANPFTSSITTDFLIGTTPVLIWMMIEGKRLKMKWLWIYFILTFLIAFAFTCPLFLFNRERKMAYM
ncbi:MAG: DUF2834 domain-containing protein [Ferruginibacter sp.]|nr:DUF2834 domain-containing protein [Ferruginibacter sp.]